MRILILPGDGIGPEIMGVARAVIETLDRRFGLGLTLEERAIGFAAHAVEGTTIPKSVVEAARAAEGVVLGPVSTFTYPPAAQGGINPSATLRKTLDLYANIRPSRARKGVRALTPEMDMIIVRENTEGFYADRNMLTGTGEFQPNEDMAFSLRKITAQGSRRIAETAFELADRRRRKVAAIHKANVLKVTDGLFLREVRAVAQRFPQVALKDVIVDAMAALLVRTPAAFDVVLATNMFGDILSDEAAELSGGLGLAGSLNVGTSHAVAQAVHGSAPDIAGKGIANPTALILSVAMLLDWLGVRHRRDTFVEAARHLDVVVDATLADPKTHTRDLGGTATTEEFGRSVVNAIGS
ncbi:MAG: isocitrate/isopropylmalate dehydrogenase family protein [Rhodospirillales bacterium]|nr:isocitrate/isopropylmalate dehydrogenase family protein [Rhodospirillales bacterium]